MDVMHAKCPGDEEVGGGRKRSGREERGMSGGSRRDGYERGGKS